jgi:hypothetical protein
MSDNSVDLAVHASTDRLVTDRLQTIAQSPIGKMAKARPQTLFAGMEAAAGEVLAIPSIRHRSALYELGGRAKISPGVVRAIHEQIARNLRLAGQRGIVSSSRENWRWCRPQPHIAEHNTSAEVNLERAIAAACLRAGRQDWANQVPVASGIVGPAADRRRAIDLVHQVGIGHFELIELKIASDTPLYAAIEIIGYGCVWLLARARRSPEANALLGADKLDLIVLAPGAYYAPFQLDKLEALLDAELAALGERNGVHMAFRFERLPDQLVQPSLLGDDTLLELLDLRRPL